MEALDVSVLSGLAWLNMNQLNLLFDTPGQKMAAGQFGSVVAANRSRFAPLLDDFIQHACHAPAGEAGINLQGEALAGKSIDHAQHPDRSTCRDRIVHKIQCPFLVGCRVLTQRSTLPDAVFTLLPPQG